MVKRTLRRVKAQMQPITFCPAAPASYESRILLVAPCQHAHYDLPPAGSRDAPGTSSSGGGAEEGLDMSGQWSELDSEQPYAESEATGSSIATGADGEDAVVASDGSVEQPVATDGEPAVESPTAEDEGSVFLAELVRAMQTTVGRERIRTVEDTERRRQAQIDRIRVREASDTDRMRELADEDMKAIEAWAEGETTRIQLERERRAAELNEDLRASKAEHRSKIEREIEGVETAIATYRAEVDAFFAGLDRQTDLILIAQQAARRPVFPNLEVIAETVTVSSADADEIESSDEPAEGMADDATGAERDRATEPAVVGIMDLQEAAEPVAATTGSGHGSGGSLLQSVAVLRPMSWLRRDANGGDHPDRES